MLPPDKTLYYYGRPFHLLIDSITQPHRDQVLARIPDGAYVLDAGCGTGELAIALRAARNCRVTGVDLSVRMIDYARGRNPYPEVTFLHADASALSEFGESAFEFGILCQVLHELPLAIQPKVVREIVRCSREVLLLDHNAPLPRNPVGTVSRLIEATLGRDHHANFKSYLAAGGLPRICAEAGVADWIVENGSFNQGCHQVVRIRKDEAEPAMDHT